MHYVLSDIHGEMERYIRMLEMIGFGERDQLYIIGDVIDRKPHGIAILQDIMGRGNVHMLLGNHELMCLHTLGRYPRPDALYMWKCNGGRDTRRDLLYRMDAQQRHRILRYLHSLPDCLDLTVEEKAFHLVHGWVGEDMESRVWGRPSADAPNPFHDGRTVVVGHTPVCFFQCGDDRALDAYFRDLEQRGDHMRIAHLPGFIGIDCGCGHRAEQRRLACLRLEDMAEFYA